MKSCCLSGVHMKGRGYSLYREYTSAN